MDNIAGITIVAAHNKNIDISGITFKNQNGNHYVEVNGSKMLIYMIAILESLKRVLEKSTI